MATDRIRTPNLDRQGAQANVGAVDPSTVDTTLQAPSDFTQQLQAGANLGTQAQFDASGLNILPNGGFEQGLSNWTDAFWGAAITAVDATTFIEGAQSATHLESGWSQGGLASDKYDLPAQLPTTLQVSWQARWHAVGGNNYVQARGKVDFYDSGGSLIYTSSITSTAISVDTWSFLAFQAEVPANAVQFAVTVYFIVNGSLNVQVWLDDVEVQVIPFVLGALRTVPDPVNSHDPAVEIIRDTALWYPGHPNGSPAYIQALISTFTSPGPTNTDILLWLLQGPSIGAQASPWIGMYTDPTTARIETNGILNPMQGIGNAKVGNINWNDFTPAANTNFQTVTAVSSSDILLASPNLSIKTGIMVIVVADWETLSAGGQNNIKIGLLMDGGSTYTFGKINNVDNGTGAGTAIAIATTATCSLVGVPTGAIKAQLQVKLGTAANSCTIRNMEARYVITPSL